MNIIYPFYLKQSIHRLFHPNFYCTIHYRSIFNSGLKDRLAECIPKEREKFKLIKEKHAKKSLGETTVQQALTGARGVKCLIWETSLLDANEGIRFRGLSIPELQEKLPPSSGKTGEEPGPEALLWLLLTSEIPTAENVRAVTKELHSRAKLPEHLEPMIRNFPSNMHAMTQLSLAVCAMQSESIFAKAYEDGLPKTQYWDPIYEDIMNLIANLPEIAALIYRCKFKDGKVASYNSNLDYSANFNRMLGYDSHDFDELMRLYLVIHSDHEGGNASAHTTHFSWQYPI